MSKEKVFFGEMVIGIRDYQSFADFCSKYKLWFPNEKGLNWDRDNFFLTRMLHYSDNHAGDGFLQHRMERETLLAAMRKTNSQEEINKIYQKWSHMIHKMKEIRGLPLYEIFSEHLFQMISFNGKGGLWLDPVWTVLINPKFLQGLELIPEPEERVFLAMGSRLPVIISGDTFGIACQNGVVFSDSGFDTKSLCKFLALWEAGEVIQVGNELQPSTAFSKNLNDAKSYNEGRVTKVRTHWRTQRYGKDRMIPKRKLIWEHPMRLPDRTVGIQPHFDEIL